LIAEPGLPLREVSRRVRSDVRQMAMSVNHAQFPAVYDQLDGDFSFTAASAEVGVAGADPCAAARADWALVAGSDDVKVLEGFLAAYPGCPVFQALAQGRMLTAKQSTVSNSSKEAAAVSQQPQETESEQRTDTMLVAELQVALIEKGCLGGTPDGIVGIKTLDAIRRYNEQNRAAINAFRLKATDPGIVLSAISQSCDSTIGAANSLCFKFNGETVCE
jgi:hypothetical protein